MKMLLGFLATILLATTLLANSAEARCWWNGYARVCDGWHGGPYWHGHYGYRHGYYHHGYYRHW